MPSETFFCPRCKRQLTKSAQAYVYGEMMADKDANFIMMGSIAQNVTCPGCSCTIDAHKMILGEYDYAYGTPRKSGKAETATFWILFIGLWALFCMGLDWPWWGGLLGGFACGGVVFIIVGTIMGKMRK
jgi:hypothetical protein